MEGRNWRWTQKRALGGNPGRQESIIGKGEWAATGRGPDRWSMSKHQDTQQGESRQNTITGKSGKKQLVSEHQQNQQWVAESQTQAWVQAEFKFRRGLAKRKHISTLGATVAPTTIPRQGLHRRARVLAWKYKASLNYKELSKSSLKKCKHTKSE